MSLYLNSLLDNTVNLQLDNEVIQENLNDQPLLAVLEQCELREIPTAKPKIFSIKALLCTIGQLKYAIPLTHIFKIVLTKDYQKHISLVPGYLERNYGLLTAYNKVFEIVDITQILNCSRLNSNYKAVFDNYRYLLLISDTAQAILCNSIEDFTDLSFNNIKQTTDRCIFPWKIGTLFPELIPVLDLIALLKANLAKKC